MPVSITRLRDLIELAASGGVEGINLTEDGTQIRITRGAAPLPRKVATAPPETPVPAAEAGIFPAPMFGVLHLTPAPGAKPFVAVGERITRGQQLCLIEAMKMFNAVTADRDGLLVAILAEPGSEVANGQPLFRLVAG